jgi:predicted nucleic acid-binding protein
MSRKKIYWDTSIFLCFLNEAESDRRKICEDVLHHARLDEIRIYTSTYTIAEVIAPKRKAIPNAVRLTAIEVGMIRSMFKWPFIIPIELDERTAHMAVGIARDYSLAPADSVHAASAILWKLEAIHAWDRDFSAVSKIIKVESPQFISPQATLPGIEARLPIGPRPEDFTAFQNGIILPVPIPAASEETPSQPDQKPNPITTPHPAAKPGEMV